MNRFEQNILHALEEFSLDKSIYDKMSYRDLKLVLNSLLTTENKNFKLPLAKILLDNKKKLTRSVSFKLNQYNLPIQHSLSLDFDVPMDAGIDIMFNDLMLNKNNINSLI